MKTPLGRFAFVGFLILAGCSGAIVIDRSTDAFAARDFTLINACDATPSGGLDSCHATSGDTIDSAWTLIAPKPKSASHVTGGTVDVYFKDIHKSYPISDWTVQIPWADFFGITKWTEDLHLGVVEALVTLNWVDNEKVEQVTKYRGLAVLLVTAPGYERLPIDSGNQAWGTKCTVQYSTAGRSVVKCK